MKKLILVVLAFVAFGVGKSEAAAAARGAKASATLAYSTTVSSVSIPGSSVLYEVVMSTGATADFCAVFDTGTVTGITSALTTTGVMKTRCYAGSASAATFCVYDPPLQFNLGMAAVLSTASDHCLVVYERGRLVEEY